MDKFEIYTLILGLLIVAVLTCLYLRYRVRRVLLRQYIIHASKPVRRAYYILKHNGYFIEAFNKNFYFDILFDNKLIKNKFTVMAVARKENKKYLCFMDTFLVSDYQINYEILFQMVVSGSTSGVLVDTEHFVLQEVKLT
ncbi:MAG: hypothetical protein PHF84_12540 [bacterium]|nr:hypothetical protein [bacterium]